MKLTLVMAALLVEPASCALVGSAVRGASPAEALYVESCGSCHDPVPPHAYSDVQWRGVISRMQPETGLTDDEAKVLLDWAQENNN